MEINWPKPGKYLIAVSGGVDSVALLHLLASAGKYDLKVAHFNHKLRDDSDLDEDLVRDLALGLGLSFTSDSWSKPKSSEAAARHARYEFLHGAANGRSIITAHHRDDLVETVILNIIRGTGRTGLSPFRGDIVRPLEKVPKERIYDYAKSHGLSWREDGTNLDTKYLRNKIRHDIVPTLDSHELLQIINEAGELNNSIESDLAAELSLAKGGQVTFNTKALRARPFSTLTEILRMAVLTLNPGAEIDSVSLESAALHIKKASSGQIRLGSGLFAGVGNDTVTIAFLP